MANFSILPSNINCCLLSVYSLFYDTSYTAEPLKDLAAHEEETSFFAPEYAYILNNADMLMSQFKKQPARLERLYGKPHQHTVGQKI